MFFARMGYVISYETAKEWGLTFFINTYFKSGEPRGSVYTDEKGRFYFVNKPNDFSGYL